MVKTLHLNYFVEGFFDWLLCFFISANLDPAELKKLRSKQRKAAKKAEQNKAEEKKKEEKKAEHQKSKSGGNTVWDYYCVAALTVYNLFYVLIPPAYKVSL